MNNRYETVDIKQMAKYLKLRKEVNIPTFLFLGSRASSLFSSGLLYELLNPFHTGGFSSRVSPSQKFSACFHILKTLDPDERSRVLQATLKGKNVEYTETYIAELARYGFFKRLVTTDIATTLESAFVSTGMKENRDFEVFPSKNILSQTLVRYTNRETLFTFIKYFSDLAPDDSPMGNRTRPLELMDDLNQRMNDIRNWHILIVGLDPVWDRHIMPRLFPRNGTVWYVNEEPPSEDSLLDDHLQECKTQYILGSKGEYKCFFQELANLMGASEPSPTSPSARVENAEDTVILRQFLKERAEEVRRNESAPPPSLTIAAHRLYSTLPSGVFAYYDAQTMPLIKYEIKNGAAKAVTVRLAAEIRDYSDPCIDTIVVPAHSLHTIHHQLPTLDKAKISTLTETTPTVVHIRTSYLKDGVELLYSTQNIEVYLIARNVIRWIGPDIERGGSYRPLFNHIAAWITPDKSSIKAMLRQATDYHPQKALLGYPPKPDPTVVRGQIKAIFQALKKDGKIAYLNSPFVVGTGNNDRLQKIRLPDESLREQQANCIDGAVLYASLIESASLQPVIIIETRNAFVGWKTSKDATSYEFLDTTMTLSHSFEDAWAEGMRSYHNLQENGWFEHEAFDYRGFARLLDITELRDLGLFPMEE